MTIPVLPDTDPGIVDDVDDGEDGLSCAQEFKRGIWSSR